jgi:ABC-type transport system substrate-binding protein
MRLKQFLIFAPIVLILFLLQSYFWAPTRQSQTVDNPARGRQYIEASIGDAKILNPILYSDASSGEIIGQVFDSLVDTDADLHLRGRLARSWETHEITYLAVNPRARFPDGTPVDGTRLLQRLRTAVDGGRFPALHELVQDIRLQPAARRVESEQEVGKDGKVKTYKLVLDVPPRIRFRLRRVDQHFFRKLEPVIGPNYARSAHLDRYIHLTPANPKLLAAKKDEWLPVLEHNPIIVFHLRHGVRFHDGVEFTARDVKFTYDAIMNPKNLSPLTSDFEPIKRVEIVDPYTVRVIYKRLFSPAINAWAGLGILPAHLLDKKALEKEMDRRGITGDARKTFGMRDSDFNRHPIGTGPFRFVSWSSDELIHLTRNNDYWDGPPEYKDFYYRVIPDPVTQEVEFRTGAIDAYAPLPHQAARYRDNKNYQTYSSLAFGYTYIGYNNRRPLFRDPRVRRALGMALNVKQIIKYVMYGEAKRINGPYPPNTDWYNKNVKPLPYDPQGALRILESLGWKRNSAGWLEKDGKIFQFNLVTNQGNTTRADIATIAQNQWRKIGIKCNTQVFEWAVFLQDFINKRDFDAVILGWSGLGPLNPDLYQIWHSSQVAPGKLNFVGYDDPRADKLMVEIRREYNHARQVELTHRLDRIIAQDQPYTFLFAPMSTIALDKRIVQVNKDGTYSKLKPTRTGNVYYYFNRWRKLAYAPNFK